MSSCGNKLIFFLGDSIAAGQGVPILDSWPLRAAVALQPHGVHALVSAVNGETTRGALERFDRHFLSLSQAPEYLYVQYGINDGNYWQTSRGFPRVSIDSFTQNLMEIVDRAVGVGVQLVLIGTNHPVDKDLPSAANSKGRLISNLQESVARYNHAIRVVAESSESCQLIDFESVFSDGSHLMDDGVHLSPVGHRRQADFFVSSLSGIGLCNDL